MMKASILDQTNELRCYSVAVKQSALLHLLVERGIRCLPLNSFKEIPRLSPKQVGLLFIEQDIELTLYPNLDNYQIVSFCEPQEAIQNEKHISYLDPSQSELLLSNRLDEIVERIRLITTLDQNEKAMEDFRILEQAFSSIASNILIRLNSSRRVTHINQGGLSLLGFSKREVLGKDWLSEFVHSSDVDAFENTLNTLSNWSDMEESISDFKLQNAYGEALYISWNVKVQYDEQGNVIEYILTGLDISEQVQAKHGQQILHEIVESSPTVLFRWSNEHSLPVSVVTSNIQRFGYYPDQFISKELSYLDIIYPEDVETFLQQITEFVASHDHYLTHKYRIISPSGQTFIVSDTTEVVRDIAGDVIYFQGLVTDTTAQKQLESQVDILAKAMEHSNDSVIITDLNGKITYVNSAFSKVSGYDKSEVLGKNPRILQSGLTPQSRFTDMWQTINSGETWSGTLVNKTKSGKEYRELCIITPVLDDDHKIEHYIAIKKDITEQYQTEEELQQFRHHLEELVDQRTTQLKEAEFKYRTIANYTYNWEIWQDNERNILFCSNGAKRITGYSPEVFRNDPRLMLDIIHPDDINDYLKHETDHHSRLADGQCQYRIIDNLGQTRWISHNCSAVVDDFGVVIGRRICNEDITDYKQAEIALKQARDNADAANHAKSAFLANMSHEIRTPMNAIIGLTHLLRQRVKDPDSRHKVTQIDLAAEHLLSIINDILDLSKIESGKIILENIDFNLEQSINKVVGMLEHQANSKGLELVADTKGCDIWVNGDETRIQQALINYIGNAIKFSHHGRIIVKAEIPHRKNNLTMVRFSVKDQGVGVSEDKLQTIFEAFEQADSATTRRYGGTGLGLTIVRNIAQLMGGDASASSKLGKGSTFWFTCWLTQGTASKEIEPEPDTSYDMDITQADLSGRILVAEDNEINAEVALELLTSFGLEVDIAVNGVKALEACDEQTYDLILMDVQMPEMDGIQATREIRKQFESKQLPILAMTANIFDSDKEECVAAGMNDFVAKPVEPNNLFSMLQKWLPQLQLSRSANPQASDLDDDSELSNLQVLSVEQIKLGLSRVANKKDVYIKLLGDFRDLHCQDGDRLAELIASQAIDSAILVAHSLKGAAANIGLDAVAELAAELEQLITENNDVQKAQQILGQLEQLLEQFSKDVIWLKPADVGAKHSIDETELVDKINTICSYVKEDDTEANSLFTEFRQDIYEFDSEFCIALEKALNNYDYPQALEHINQKMMPSSESSEQSIVDEIDSESSISIVTEDLEVNLPIFDQEILTATLGANNSKVGQLLTSFMQQAENSIPEIEAELTANNIESVRFMTHKLKSSAKAMGAMALSAICYEMEKAARNDDNQRLVDLAPQLKSRYTELSIFLQDNPYE